MASVIPSVLRHRVRRPALASGDRDPPGRTDGNPRTRPDRDWTPLVTTPPIPDHDSAHAAEGGAAARVMARFFGRDRFGFELCSRSTAVGTRCTDDAPVTRRYHSLSQAARENARSRVLVGIHFRHAARAGLHRGYRAAVVSGLV